MGKIFLRLLFAKLVPASSFPLLFAGCLIRIRESPFSDPTPLIPHFLEVV